MEKKLLLIRHLYGELDDRADLNELLEDPELKAEYDALSEAKFWLDHSKREKPSSDVLQHILAAAVPPSQNIEDPSPVPRPASDRHVRQDRPPQQRTRSSRKRVFGGITMALATLFTALIGYQWYTNQSPLNSTGLAQESAAEQAAAFNNEIGAESSLAEGRQSLNTELEERERTDALMADDFAGGAIGNSAPAQPSASLASRAIATDQDGLSPASITAADSVLPDWDKVEEVIQYRQRIEMLLRQNTDLVWDQPVVPLESLPGNRITDPRLRQAGSPSQGNQN